MTHKIIFDRFFTCFIGSASTVTHSLPAGVSAEIPSRTTTRPSAFTPHRQLVPTDNWRRPPWNMKHTLVLKKVIVVQIKIPRKSRDCIKGLRLRAVRQAKFYLPRQAAAPQYVRRHSKQDTLLSLVYCRSCTAAKAAVLGSLVDNSWPITMIFRWFFWIDYIAEGY